MVTIAAQGNHTLALLNDGTVRAWGDNEYGQLGNSSIDYFSNVPITVNGLSDVISVSGGFYNSIALLADGTVRTWGYNQYGQLGNNSTTQSNVPVTVSGLSNVAAVTGGLYSSMALLNDGTVRTWGSNSNGQLGNGTTTSSNVPVTVSGLNNVAGIAMGGGNGDFGLATRDSGGHSLALLADGTVYSWGDNASGQLGTGNNTNSTTPVNVPNLNGVISVAAGGYHSLALLNNGTMSTWGNNFFGQVNNNYSIGNVPNVRNLGNVTGVSGGFGHTMALLADGTVLASGFNYFGQVGNGTIGFGTGYFDTVRGLSGVAQPAR